MAELPFLPRPPMYGTPFSGPGTDPGFINPLPPAARNPFAGPHSAEPVPLPVPGLPGPFAPRYPNPVPMPWFSPGGDQIGNIPRFGQSPVAMPWFTPRSGGDQMGRFGRRGAGIAPRRPISFGSEAVRGLLGNLGAY